MYIHYINICVIITKKACLGELQLKPQKSIIIACLSLILLSACSSNSANQPVHLPTEAPSSVAATPTPSTVAEETETSSQLIVEELEAVSYLKKALDITKDIDKVQYYQGSNVLTYYTSYDDSATPLLDMYYSTNFGNMQREPANAFVESYLSSYLFDNTNEDDPYTLEEYIRTSDYYVSKDLGIFYSDKDEHNWFSDDVPNNLKTVGHVEDLISFFLQFPEQLTITDLPLEGDMEEQIKYKEITLNLTVEQFVEHTAFLIDNFFTGNYNTRHENQLYYVVSPEVKHHQISLTLDELNRISGLFVDMESTLYDEEDTRYIDTSYIYFSYEDQVDIPTIVVSEEVIASAASDKYGE